ncbi:MAG TPA: C40 family peptidase, partial [Clostridiaceae bacterium]|nr:C40 family peptidase [Clostridiaceae bacterium]
MSETESNVDVVVAIDHTVSDDMNSGTTIPVISNDVAAPDDGAAVSSEDDVDISAEEEATESAVELVELISAQFDTDNQDSISVDRTGVIQTDAESTVLTARPRPRTGGGEEDSADTEEDVVLPRTVISNGAPEQIFQDIEFRTDVPDSITDAYFYHYVNKPDGESEFIGKSHTPYFTHRFRNPNTYWWLTVIYDQNQNVHTTKLPLTIADNWAIARPYIGPVHPIYTNIEAQYGFEVTGGGRIQRTRMDLIDSENHVTLMTEDNQAVLWNVVNPDQYIFQVTVYDEGGRKSVSQIKLNLIEQPAAPTIEAFNHNKSLLKEDFDYKQTGFVVANSATENALDYEFWLSKDGAKPYQITWPNVNRVAYEFTEAGSYRMFAVVRDGVSRYAVASKGYVVLENAPEVDLLYVNRTQYEENKKVILVTKVKPDTGRGDLTYQYITYSWTNGRRIVGNYATPNQVVTVNDPNIVAFQVIVKDAHGRTNKDEFFRVKFPGALKDLSGTLDGYGTVQFVHLAWTDQLKPTGYLVLRNNVFVEEVTSIEYDDYALPGFSSYTYRIVPYLSLSGKSYYNTPQSQRVALFSFYNEKTVSPRPTTIEEMRYYYGRGRDLVCAIARDAVGKIPYAYGKMRLPGKSGYEAVPSEGLRCSGFVEWVFNAAGYTAEELGRWNWTGSMMLDSVTISEWSLTPGDLGFSSYMGSHSNHVGIYMGRDDNGNRLWAHLPAPGTYSRIDTYTGFKNF